MSLGMTPQEFVQQVYYAQEKVILDFLPTNDKYREVIMEANFVLQELQKEEDWSWLRESVVLGTTRDVPDDGHFSFELPDTAYKPCTYHNDSVRLHEMHGDFVIEHSFIEVPYISSGSLHKHRIADSYAAVTHLPDLTLGAVVVGNKIHLTRPLFPHELNRTVMTDVQKRLTPLHICDSSCASPCTDIETRIFTEIPDPLYMVYRTAALHAEGSPPAEGRLLGLQDQAQKLLSAMRQNDASKTAPDYIERVLPCFVNIV